MQPLDPAMNRRNFLKTGAAAGSLLALGGSAARAALPVDKRITLAGKIPETVFGRTGHRLPVFGHGGSAMIQQDIAKYGLELISIEERIKMVRHGYDQGIRYFDTARIYGESEGIMGEALKDVRDDVFLASKAMVATVDKIRPSVEQSLVELKTDYVDSMQIHGPIIERIGYDGCMPLFEELAKLRDEGLIRFIGITGHSRFEEMYKLIASGNFDTVLIEFGYFKKGYNTRHSDVSVEWRDACVSKAHELNMGVVAMKVMSAMIFSHNSAKIAPDFDPERRAKLPAAAIRYVLSDPRVNILNLGISFPKDIDANLEILTGDLTFTNDDRLLLAEFSAIAYQHPEVQELRVV